MVVITGDTPCDPFTFAATGPMPWSMLTVSALAQVHERVEDTPSMTVPGVAEILTMGNWPTLTVTSAVLEPYAFVAVRV